MEKEPKNEVVHTQQVVAKHTRERRTGLFIVGGLIFAALAAVLMAYFLGYLYVGTKTPAQRVAIGSHVCGEALVNEFNTRTQNVSYPMSDSDKTAFQAIKQKIASSKGNEDDPTCQTMLFQIAYTDMKVSDMDAAYQHVQASYDKGVYADSNLLTGYHPNTMKSFMNDARGN